MKRRTKGLSRRDFLLAAVAGTAGAAGAIGTQSRTLPRVAGVRKKLSRGYQESGHVNNYYRTAKV